MKEHGLISSFEDYVRLPVAVFDDWLIYASGQAYAYDRARNARSERSERSGRRGKQR